MDKYFIAFPSQAVRTDKGRPLSCSSSTGWLLLRPHLQKKIQEFVQTPSHTNTLTRRNQNNVAAIKTIEFLFSLTSPEHIGSSCLDRLVVSARE